MEEGEKGGQRTAIAFVVKDPGAQSSSPSFLVEKRGGGEVFCIGSEESAGEFFAEAVGEGRDYMFTLVKGDCLNPSLHLRRRGGQKEVAIGMTGCSKRVDSFTIFLRGGVAFVSGEKILPLRLPCTWVKIPYEAKLPSR